MKKTKISKTTILSLAYFLVLFLLATNRWWLSPLLTIVFPQVTSLEQLNNIKLWVQIILWAAFITLLISVLIVNGIAIFRNRAAISSVFSIRFMLYYAFIAYWHWRWNNYSAARASITKLINFEPAPVFMDSDLLSNLYFFRGLTYKIMDDFSLALVDFNTAIEINQKNADFYSKRSQIHIALRNFEAALADMNKAIELKPNAANFYEMRGWIYRKLENLSAALNDFNKLVELQPKYAAGYNQRGWTYKELKNFAAALADYGKVMEIQPALVDSYFNRALIFFEIENYSAALTDFSTAIKLQPTDFESYYHRGLVYADIKNFPAALADYTKTIQLKPDFEPAYCNRGLVFLEIRDFPAALADYSKAMALEPDDDAPIFDMACLYALQSQPDESCSWLRRAIEMSAENIELAKTDADFDPIRDTPQFQALMNEFEK